MTIDAQHPGTSALIEAWHRIPRDEKPSQLETFRGRFAMEIIEAELQKFPGELVLFHHEFLSMQPTGGHSFARGLEMAARTIHWVTAGRTAVDPSLVTRPGTRAWFDGTGFKNVTTGTDHFIPVQWKRRLKTRHECGAPLVIDDEIPPSDGSERLIDISSMGQHLLSCIQPGRLDWATRLILVIGNDAVREWLDVKDSPDACETLAAL